MALLSISTLSGTSAAPQAGHRFVLFVTSWFNSDLLFSAARRLGGCIWPLINKAAAGTTTALSSRPLRLGLGPSRWGTGAAKVTEVVSRFLAGGGFTSRWG